MPTSVFAEPNPSANVQNGEIWRYNDTAGKPVVDPDFDIALDAGDVRMSQQVIADNGNGSFDVELKVQYGSNIKVVSEAAVVFVLDESGSVGTANWNQMRIACVQMVNSFSTDADIYFGIVKFGSNATISSSLTNNRDTINNTLNLDYQLILT